MKKEKKIFRFQVYETVKNDILGEITNMVYQSSRIGVSAKQIETQVRYSANFYNHDERNGSESHTYEFIFEDLNGEPIPTKESEMKNDSVEGYTEYGYYRRGIEYSNDNEAYES